MRVSVIGGGAVEEAVTERAREVGRLLGERGHELVCGGRGGVMAAACEGAVAAGGHTVGILPGEDPADANEHVETVVVTGLGNARNVLVALNGDATVAVDGGPGTLSEIAHALDAGRPVAGLDAPVVRLPGFEAVETPRAAVESVEARVDVSLW